MRLALVIAIWGAGYAYGASDGEAVRCAAEMRQQFDCGFRIHTSDHFALVEDEDREVAARLRLFEETYSSFFAHFEAAGFRLERPAQALTCVVLADEGQFARYAMLADQVDMSWSRGYYSTRTNRVALYQRRSDAPQRQKTVRVTAAGDGEQTPQPYGNAGVAWASSTHEVAHQLAFNSGLLRPGVMYPLWVAEGLATSFEYNGAQSDLGPYADNVLRRRDLERAMAEGRMMPLGRLVTLTQVAAQDLGELDAVYAECWSAFRYLVQRRSGELRGYLARLYEYEPGPRPSQVLLREFTASFGSLEKFERDWRRWASKGN